jgi:hypothetical protein
MPSYAMTFPPFQPIPGIEEAWKAGWLTLFPRSPSIEPPFVGGEKMIFLVDKKETQTSL